jgi:hypothetical protein
MSALDRLKLLGDRADPLTRWQAEAELRTEAEQRQRRSEERERHRERAAMAESEQVQALRHEIADLRHELATVQARLTERDKDFIGIADTIVAGLDKVPAWVEKTRGAGEALRGRDVRQDKREIWRIAGPAQSA